MIESVKTKFMEKESYKPPGFKFRKQWTAIQEANGKSTAPKTAATISSKAWDSTVEYPS